MKRKRIDDNVNLFSENKKRKKIPKIIEIIRKLSEICVLKENFVDQLKEFNTQLEEFSPLKEFIELILIKFSFDVDGVKEMKKRINLKMDFLIQQKIVEITDLCNKMEEECCDPISKLLIRHPVTLKETGITYDRFQITTALGIKLKCPVTNKELSTQDKIEDYFVTNFDKKRHIEKLSEKILTEGLPFLCLLRDVKLDFITPYENALALCDKIRLLEIKENKQLEDELNDIKDDYINKISRGKSDKNKIIKLENEVRKLTLQVENLQKQVNDNQNYTISEVSINLSEILAALEQKKTFLSNTFDMFKIQWTVQLELNEDDPLTVGVYLLNCSYSKVFANYFVLFGEKRLEGFRLFEKNNGWGSHTMCSVETLNLLAKDYPDNEKYVTFIVGIKNVYVKQY